jgi:type II secretory pathway component PulK
MHSKMQAESLSMNYLRPSSKERGIAIVMAVLIVALAASAAAFAAWQQGIWIRQAENRTNQIQALAIARAAVDLGRAILAKDASDAATAATDNLEESTPYRSRWKAAKCRGAFKICKDCSI